uniref:Uncharacterized protein n=1 Tax=Tanacetum cinerariifolium TaxID=118510 RepID=A0A699SYG2_TANCI|nr:hypothetical protein [Tanacetum cinerariifolium]
MRIGSADRVFGFARGFQRGKEHTYHGRNIHIMEGNEDTKSELILRFPKCLPARAKIHEKHRERAKTEEESRNGLKNVDLACP